MVYSGPRLGCQGRVVVCKGHELAVATVQRLARIRAEGIAAQCRRHASLPTGSQTSSRKTTLAICLLAKVDRLSCERHAAMLPNPRSEMSLSAKKEQALSLFWKTTRTVQVKNLARHGEI